MTPEITDYEVCGDCYLLAMTGDATSLDYHYGEDADRRQAEITEGLDAIATTSGHFSAPDDNETEFARWPCECCGCSLAGTRYTLQWVEMTREEP